MFKKYLIIMGMTTALSFFAFTLVGYAVVNNPAPSGQEVRWDDNVARWQ